jgi:hypothetical protein
MPVNGPSFDSVSASLVSAVSEHSASERGRRGLRGAGERARLCTPLHERRGSSPARHGDIASRNFTQLRGDFTPTSRNFTCAREARASENFRLIKPITIIFIVSPALATPLPVACSVISRPRSVSPGARSSGDRTGWAAGGAPSRFAFGADRSGHVFTDIHRSTLRSGIWYTALPQGHYTTFD